MYNSKIQTISKIIFLTMASPFNSSLFTSSEINFLHFYFNTINTLQIKFQNPINKTLVVNAGVPILTPPGFKAEVSPKHCLNISNNSHIYSNFPPLIPLF